MPDPTVLTVRLDERSEAALAYLSAERRDVSEEEVVSAALIETADAHRRAALRAEALEAAHDPADRAAARGLAREMGGLDA